MPNPPLNNKTNPISIKNIPMPIAIALIHPLYCEGSAIGLPQFGQALASEEIVFPHSGQLMSAISFFPFQNCFVSALTRFFTVTIITSVGTFIFKNSLNGRVFELITLFGTVPTLIELLGYTY